MLLAWLTCLHARVSQLLRLDWRRHAYESWAALVCSLPATENVTSQTMSLHGFGVSVVCQCWQMVADASDTCEGSVKAYSAPWVGTPNQGMILQACEQLSRLRGLETYLEAGALPLSAL